MGNCSQSLSLRGIVAAPLRQAQLAEGADRVGESTTKIGKVGYRAANTPLPCEFLSQLVDSFRIETQSSVRRPIGWPRTQPVVACFHEGT